MALPNAQSNFIMQPIMPGALSEERHARNGDVPSAIALRRAAWQQNHVAMHQRKQLFSFANNSQSTPDPSGISVTNMHFCFRTGEAVAAIRVIIGLAPASNSSGSNQARCTLEISDDTDLISSNSMVYAKVQTGFYTPSEILWATEEITLADGLLPNKLYRASIRQTYYSRVNSVMAYEVASTVASSSDVGIANPLRWEADKPIYYQGAQDLAETGTKLWRHNATQLISWSRRATGATITSTSYVNVLDTSKTAYGAANPGFVLNTQYHDSLKSGGVPVELAIFATRVSGTGTLDIQLQNSGGTVLTETAIASPADAPFASSTHLITAAASDKTDILARVSSGTWRIDAIGLWEYEA